MFVKSKLFEGLDEFLGFHRRKWRHEKATRFLPHLPKKFLQIQNLLLEEHAVYLPRGTQDTGASLLLNAFLLVP